MNGFNNFHNVVKFPKFYIVGHLNSPFFFDTLFSRIRRTMHILFFSESSQCRKIFRLCTDYGSWKFLTFLPRWPTIVNSKFDNHWIHWELAIVKIHKFENHLLLISCIYWPYMHDIHQLIQSLATIFPLFWLYAQCSKSQ